MFVIGTATDAEIQDRVKTMLIKSCGPRFDERIEALQAAKPDLHMDLLFDQCVQLLLLSSWPVTARLIDDLAL